MDKVSVIIPVYNVEPYIRKCLDSIINQTYSNLEVLIIDDGSPDNCGAICDEYGEKYDFVKIFHKENEGLSSARNLGLDNATGEWILFVDSDDWCEINYIEKMICGLSENNTDIDVIISSSVHEINHKKTKIHALMEKEGVYKTSEIIDIVQGKSFCISYINEKYYGIAKNSTNSAPWDKLYRRKIINENNLRYSEELKVHEDRLFNLQYFAYVKAFKYIDARGYYYRFVGGSITKKYDTGRIKKEKVFSNIVYNFYISSGKTQLKYATSLGALQILNGVRSNLSTYHNGEEKREKNSMFLELTKWPIMEMACDSLHMKDIEGFKFKLLFIVLKYKSFFLLSVGTKIFKKR